MSGFSRGQSVDIVRVAQKLAEVLSAPGDEDDDKPNAMRVSLPMGPPRASQIASSEAAA
jgi:hypothetical protein